MRLLVVGVIVALAAAACGGGAGSAASSTPVPPTITNAFTLKGLPGTGPLASGPVSAVTCGKQEGGGYLTLLTTTFGSDTYHIQIEVASYSGPKAYQMGDTVSSPSVLLTVVAPASASPPAVAGYLSEPADGTLTILNGGRAGTVYASMVPAVKSGGSLPNATLLGSFSC